MGSLDLIEVGRSGASALARPLCRRRAARSVWRRGGALSQRLLSLEAMLVFLQKIFSSDGEWKFCTRS